MLFIDTVQFIDSLLLINMFCSIFYMYVILIKHCLNCLYVNIIEIIIYFYIDLFTLEIDR